MLTAIPRQIPRTLYARRPPINPTNRRKPKKPLSLWIHATPPKLPQHCHNNRTRQWVVSGIPNLIGTSGEGGRELDAGTGAAIMSRIITPGIYRFGVNARYTTYTWSQYKETFYIRSSLGRLPASSQGGTGPPLPKNHGSRVQYTQVALQGSPFPVLLPSSVPSHSAVMPTHSRSL